MNNTINLKKYKLVIFDIDGTLYDQKKLRFKMSMDILIYYLIRPNKIFELKIIKIFREEREKRKGIYSENLENEQYLWVEKKINYPTEIIRNIIKRWIFERPIKYLYKCKYSGIEELFLFLKKNNIMIGIYSDYPTKKKMEALRLKADIEVASTDKDINALKPNPKGLLYIKDKFDFNIKECLFIGDRENIDGMCAKNAGMDYLIIDKKGKIFEQLLR